MTRRGGCACGAVRYRFDGDPLFVHACHCKDCQRLTGSAFAITMLIEEARFIVDEGEPLSGEVIAGSGGTKRTYFCGRCGSYLWSRPPARPGLLGVRPGGLDETDWFEPQAHIWTRSKQRWVRLPPDVPAFETAYAEAELWPRESIERRARAGARAQSAD